MVAPHDCGGWPTAEAIDQGEHEWADWEHQTQARYSVLSCKSIMAVDELRYLMLPRHPEGSESMSEGELRELVIRDSIIGVRAPLGPEHAPVTAGD